MTPDQPDPASESHDREAATTGPAAGGGHDAERRAFFFKFGKEAVTAVGQAAGMADIVGRTSSSVAAGLLGLGGATAKPPPQFTRSTRRRRPDPARIPAAEDSYRSAYRLGDGELILLDQRGIPERLEDVTAKRGSDVAYYLRLGVARGGPLMAQLAAYGMALTAAERASQPAEQRELELRRTGRALTEARPSALAVARAVERSAAAAGDADADDGDAVAAAMRNEADAIASEYQAANAAIAASLAAVLPNPGERPLGVLVHGDQGALHGGLVGTGLSALRQLRDEGRELRIFVTEGRPFMDGARLASWELRQAGLAHKVIPDAAAAWLFEAEPIDAVLIAAEWVTVDGDISTVIGGRALAQQAAAAGSHTSRQAPRVVACGASPVLAVDGDAVVDIPVELRPARDLSAYLADVPIRASDALVPANDVIPASLVGLLVTERGVASPLTSGTIAPLRSPSESA